MGRKRKLTPEEMVELSAKGLDLLSDADASHAAGDCIGKLVSSDGSIRTVMGTADGRIRTVHCGDLDTDGDHISTSVRVSASELGSTLVGCGDISVSSGTGGSILSSGTISAPTWVSAGTSIDISPYPYMSDERNLIFGPGSEKYNIKFDYNDAPVEMTAGQMHDMLKLVSEWIGSYAPIRLSIETDKYPETLKWIMTDLIRNTAEKCIAIVRKQASKEGVYITPGCVDRLAKAITKELINPAADKCSDLEHIILKR